MTDPQDQPEEPAWEMHMPFVTVASKGGPHDDASYTAGWECGAIDHRLAMCAAVGAEPMPMTVQTVNLRQLDLIALKHGYVMAAEPAVETPEWSNVTFTHPAEAPWQAPD